jgi:hypothetical protein
VPATLGSKRRLWVVLWMVVLLLALPATAMTALALGEKRVRVGPVIATGFVEARSGEGHGLSHWSDQTGEGWVLRLGDVHWVVALPL